MGKSAREKAKEVAATSLWPCGLRKVWTIIPGQWVAPRGLIKGNDVVKSVFGEDRPGYLLEEKTQRQRSMRGCFRSFLETGRVHTTKGSLLPVRPRYRREVDGQRLSAKADDKVCCFSPVRRSTTYQMSCFLPERSQEHTVVYTCLLQKKISQPN